MASKQSDPADVASERRQDGARKGRVWLFDEPWPSRPRIKIAPASGSFDSVEAAVPPSPASKKGLV